MKEKHSKNKVSQDECLFACYIEIQDGHKNGKTCFFFYKKWADTFPHTL